MYLHAGNNKNIKITDIVGIAVVVTTVDTARAAIVAERVVVSIAVRARAAARKA